MRPSSRCLEPSVLVRLLDDSLSILERQAATRHVHGCETCRTRLESLSHDQDGTPRAIPCPGRAVLRRFMEGTLGEFAWETLEHHVENCEACGTLASNGCWDEEEGGEDRPTSCPDSNNLRALRDGRLRGQDQAVLERHLGECEACQRRLESLDAGDAGWPGRLSELGNAPAFVSPGLKKVIGTLKDQFATWDRTTHAPASADPDQEQILHFLDPPEAEGELGKLASYRILQVLGQGGMGLVLRAFDPGLSRPIAIKVLAPQLATSGAARLRFSREARAAAAIRDEHVVAIHAVDEWKGLPYLVMELIPGISLQDRLDRSAPLDVNSILRIGMQTARGLAAAHAEGLVHRDIKPSNILLENGVERVKLTDFGLARAVDDASLTQSGVVAGTPLYMAPEQALGEAIDHRADLFSLGAVMYAMSTGRPPFRASSALGVLRRVCDDEHRPIQEVNPEIPAWLAEIIDRLLAKNRRDRFQGAAEVARILGERLAQRQRGPSVVRTSFEPHHRRPVAATEDVGAAKKPARRWAAWPWVLATMAILVAFVALGAVRREPHLLDRVAGFLGIQRPDSQLEVLRDDPRLRILIDGREAEGSRVPKTDVVFFRLKPGWHHVEGYAGDRKTEGYEVGLRPGASLMLRFKGTVDEKDLQAGAGNAPSGTSLSDPNARTLAQERSLQLAQLRLALALAKAAEQEKRAARAREMLIQGQLSQAAADVETRLLEAANLDVHEATSALINARREVTRAAPKDDQGMRERIVELFKTDPEVVRLIEDIKATHSQIEVLEATDSSRDNVALLDARTRLKELNMKYNLLWQTKSEELRFLVREPVLDPVPPQGGRRK
ncbi:MAG: serine/threonine-protein kinase [Isosphaeraceae bacterium]